MVSADSRPTAIDDLQPQKSWSEHPYFIYCCMNKLCNMRFMRNTVNYSPLLWRLNPSSVRKLWWLAPLSDNDFTDSVCSRFLPTVISHRLLRHHNNLQQSFAGNSSSSEVYWCCMCLSPPAGLECEAVRGGK